MDSLPDAFQKTIFEALKYARNKMDFWHIQEWLFDTRKWKMPKVSLDTFLDSSNYLGMGTTVYPKVREICRDIIE